MLKRTLLLLLVVSASCANCDDDSGTGLVCGPGEVAEGGACVRDIADDDGDGIPNADDNCPTLPNPDQLDIDLDGVGDVCDDCPDIANASQGGCPDDGYDPGRDTDGDGRPDISDNCPDVVNPDQADADGDSIGDACDGCAAITNLFVDDVCADNSVRPSINELAPNIYLLVDASGSMGDQLLPNRPRPWPIDEFKEAITMLPDSLLNESRVGIGQFPFQSPPDTAATCTFENLLDVDAGQATEVRAAANGIAPWGDTPTGFALQQLASQGILNDATDPQDSARPKAVVLVTDGDPTVACNSGAPVNSRALAQPEAVAGAEALASQGIPVFVVGFRSGADPANLDAIAAAGGTDAPDPTRRHFVADNSAELVAALQSIREATASCAFELTNTTPQADELIVSSDGALLSLGADGYSYDHGSSVLTLNGAACEAVQNSNDPASLEILATVIDRGTSPICEMSGAEICDYRDNNCDGQVDELCPGSNEVCDQLDNDFDGQIDEGCP